MFNIATPTPAASKTELYQTLRDAAAALLEGELDHIANAANLSSLIFHTLPDLNWAGFYFFDGRELVVGPFQGKPACVRITLDRGVCGAAARTREVQIVADVHAFPGHIACDSASNSEIVLPLVAADGRLIGVLDLDSPKHARFDLEDAQGLKDVADLYVAQWK